MSTDGLHPRVLRELVEAVTKTLSIIYQQPWLTREVLTDRKLASVGKMPIYKEGQKEIWGKSREPEPGQPDLGAGENHGADNLEPIIWHRGVNQGIMSSQQGVMKGAAFLARSPFMTRCPS